ncbi:MAG: MmgE/PrpD family protein [Candidatus Limnocylindrales bacterium]|jgi:2-methylcitrate dehydratase PrpD
MNDMQATSATQSLARLICHTSYGDLPEQVRHEAKLRIADVIGIGLSGSRTAVSRIGEFAKKAGGEGSCTIWGSGARTCSPYAALANGTQVFHLELDDVHRTSHTHPGVSTIPAALALCEERGLGGRDLIMATVLGYEACIRIGLAVSPSIYVDRTFLAPGTLSVFGAAAAAAKLMGLDEAQTAGALGAVSYFGPAAPFESFRLGAGIKDMILGWGNLCGIYGAELAAAGFEGPVTALEGDFGFFRTTSARHDTSRVGRDLGKAFEIMNTGVKPYACCRQHHAAIDCMLEMRERDVFGLDDVQGVRVRTFMVSSRGDKKIPGTIAEAKYSIPYILAVTLRDGKAWREQFTDALLGDKQLLEFASKVDVEPDQELDKLYDEKWPAIVEVRLRDGRQFSSRHDLPRGEPEFPCTAAEMKEKFVSLACDAVTPDHAASIWEAILRLDDIADVKELTALLVADT